MQLTLTGWSPLRLKPKPVSIKDTADMYNKNWLKCPKYDFLCFAVSPSPTTALSPKLEDSKEGKIIHILENVL